MPTEVLKHKLDMQTVLGMDKSFFHKPVVHSHTNYWGFHSNYWGFHSTVLTSNLEDMSMQVAPTSCRYSRFTSFLAR